MAILNYIDPQYRKKAKEKALWYGSGGAIIYYNEKANYRVLCMGVVKVDSCDPDWDWQKMMEERP